MYSVLQEQLALIEDGDKPVEETFGLWLRFRIHDKFNTLRAFAAAIGKEPTYVSRWVNDHERPSYESARQIAEILKIPIAVILDRAGMPIHESDMSLSAPGAAQADAAADLNQLAEIGRAVLRIVEERQMLTEKRLERLVTRPRIFPIINLVPADDARERASQIENNIALDPFFWQHATDPRVYIVSGDCMALSGILNDDHVVIDAAELQPRNGQVVLAELNNALTLKRFYRTPEGIELRPNAPGYDTIAVKPGDELVIVGCLHKVVPTGAR